jgi:hypothetical protein
VFHRATATLAVVLEGTDVPFHPDPAPAEIQMKSAVLNLSALALRTARAAGVVICSGYEPEAQGLKRRLSEAYARLGAVVNDESGEHARRWIAGEGPSTPRKIAGKFGNLALFDLYSDSAHATMSGLLNWVAVAMPDGRRAMPISPLREPAFADPMLVEIALECRDFAKIAGVTFERDVPGLDRLDAELLAAGGGYYAPEER